MIALDQMTTKTLVAMARALFPYDYLDDSYYAVVVDSINKNSDEARLKLLNSGAAELNKANSKAFFELSEDEQVSLLKKIENTAFFKDMHGTTVREVFNNPAIWRHFDYEGPSAQKGGYLNRGFDKKYWTDDD